jgi:hypothetical protein
MSWTPLPSCVEEFKTFYKLWNFNSFWMFWIKHRIRRFKRFNFDLLFYISFIFCFPNLKVRFILLIIKQWSIDRTIFFEFFFVDYLVPMAKHIITSLHFTTECDICGMKYIYIENFATWDATWDVMTWDWFWNYLHSISRNSLSPIGKHNHKPSMLVDSWGKKNPLQDFKHYVKIVSIATCPL